MEKSMTEDLLEKRLCELENNERFVIKQLQNENTVLNDKVDKLKDFIKKAKFSARLYNNWPLSQILMVKCIDAILEGYDD